MSIDMAYLVDGNEFSFTLTDMQVFSRLSKKYPRDCEVVFGTEEPDEYSFDSPRAVVPRTELLAALENLLIAFRRDSKLSPRRFVFDFDIIPGVPVTGDNAVCGVRLEGFEGIYELTGGIDQCVLREFRVGSDYGEPLDMRDRSVIETESHGPITVRSTKQPSQLVRDLKRLRRFLQLQSGMSVIKELH